MRYKGITEGRLIKPHNLIRLCQWLQDLNCGEMIEAPGYKRDYLSLPGPERPPDEGIGQKELDQLCLLANAFLVDYWEGYLIGNSMGEILPGKMKGDK